MVKLIVLFLSLSMFSFTASAASAAPKAAPKAAATSPGTSTAALKELKEFDLARALVDALGFSEGLPPKPAEKDYLQILGGGRTFQFEAENTFDSQNDPVAVRDFPLYGAFSGRGWIHATTRTVAVHFKIFVPITGKYRFIVTARGDNQLWSIAGKAFRHSFGDSFSSSDLGEVFIPAGELEFNAVIEPSGAIDTCTVAAPAFAPVEPLAGWHPAEPLTVAALNETVASLLGLEPLLPVDRSYPTKIIEAASLPGLSPRVYLTDKQIYGKPTAAQWVRAFQAVAPVAVPLEIDSSSVYAIRVRALGPALIAGFGQNKVTVAAKPFLDWIDLGTFRLRKGTNILTVELPPMGGIDVIEITKKLSAPADYAVIARTGLSGSTPLTPVVLETVVTSLKERFKERK